MRRLGLGLAVAGLVAACFPGLAATQADCACTKHDAMVPMSDEVRLDVSLYIPADPLLMENGKVPLLVRQHGGGSNKDSSYDVKYGLEYVKSRKFALLTYSHRGHGNSEGLFDFFGPRTTQDFSDVLDWVGTNYGNVVDTDNVGVSGYSQGGGESLLPAENDARVKAAAVGNTFDDLNHALNPNDCFKFSFATGIFALAYKTSASRTQDDIAIRWGAQWDTDTEDQGAGPVPSTTDDAATRSPMTYMHPDVARPMYKQGLQIPVFWSNSWDDQLFPADHGLDVLTYVKGQGHPVHYWFASGGHAAGPNGAADEAGKEAAMRDWMEEFLRGEDHGFASGARPEVDYAQKQDVFVPEDEWAWDHHTATSWPAAIGTDSLFAWPDGSLRTASYNGELKLRTIVNDLASANLANDAITHEVPRQIDDGIRNGLGLQTHLHNASDGIPESENQADTATFTSTAWSSLGLSGNYVGAPVVKIPYATTATRVVQFDVKVWDSTPGGPRKLIWRGCTSMEHPAAQGTALVTLWPNAHAIGGPDNRLILTISSVDFPTFKPDTEPAATTILAGTLVELPAR